MLQASIDGQGTKYVVEALKKSQFRATDHENSTVVS